MKNLAEVPAFLTVPEFAELLGQHEGSVRRGIYEGRIPADKVNGRWFICRDLVFPNAARAVSAVSQNQLKGGIKND